MAELAADDLPLLSGCVAKVVVVIPEAKLPCEGCLAIDLDGDDSWVLDDDPQTFNRAEEGH